MHVVLCETTEKDDSDEQTQSPVYDKVSAWGTDMPFLHSKVRQSILRVITGSFPWLIDLYVACYKPTSPKARWTPKWNWEFKQNCQVWVIPTVGHKLFRHMAEPNCVLSATDRDWKGPQKMTGQKQGQTYEVDIIFL